MAEATEFETGQCLLQRPDHRRDAHSRFREIRHRRPQSLRIDVQITQLDHIHAGRISFEGGGGQDVYASNIQVADLNALNACLAVVRWKKLREFYRDLENEHHSTYTTDGGMLLNGDQSRCATRP